MNHDRLRKQDQVRAAYVPPKGRKAERGKHAPWLWQVGRNAAK